MQQARVEVWPVGRPLLGALETHIAAAQADDRFRPVTVIAPSRTSALALRRGTALRAGGLFGVRFEVLPRLAELLAAPALARAGRIPAGAAARGEALRTVLRRDPGMLAPIADHPATAQALERTLADLSELPPDQLQHLPGARGAELRRLHTRVRALLRGHYDAGDLLWAAAETVTRGGADLRELGGMIAVITEPPSPAALALLTALGESTALTCLVAVTGEPPVDAALLDALGGLAPDAAAEAAAAPPPPVERILSAPDPDGEVRAAVRLLAERFHQGVPLHRMALLWTARRPYALLVRDALAAAGLPASGLPQPRLAQSLTGRALTGALALAGTDLDRDAVMHWLTAAPVRAAADGPEADGARWDALSRRAGIVRGIGQWRDRLERYAYEQRSRAERERRDDAAGPARHREMQAAQAEALASFAAELTDRLRMPRGSWSAWSGWALGLLDRYVGAARAEWADDEVEADRMVRQAVRSLGELDALGEPPDLTAFRRAVQAELDLGYGGRQKLTDGLFTGDVRGAVALDFDVVAVVGLAEGLAPARPREDPLLPDRERRAVPGLRLSVQQAHALRRGLRWALAGGGERVLCTPRSDPRGGRERLPSRWLLEEAGRLAGRTVGSEDLHGLTGAPWLQWIASFPQSLHEHPAGEAELRLAELAAAQAAGTLTAAAAADPALARGLDALHDRRTGILSRWTGLVGAHPGVALGDAALSPTRLESWAACPFRYFLVRVLDIEAVPRPEEAVRIDPRERGGLVHRVLEHFQNEAGAPAPGAPWPPGERARLHHIAERECNRWERLGVTGKTLLWRLERERLHRELDAFLDDEPALRARHGTMPAAAEHAFGFETPGPALTTADGAVVRFHGYVDRIDRSPDGTAVVVVDYKTGRPEPYRKALRADPIGLGQLLQLPVYARAAVAATPPGTPASSVHAAYWFLTEHGIQEIAWDPSGAARFETAVADIAAGIAEGCFPQRAGQAALSSEGTCARCDYELVCDLDRERRWQSVRQLPQLAGMRRLEEAGVEDGDDG
jgi:ATP-dependent helicase/nuclease subunit B